MTNITRRKTLFEQDPEKWGKDICYVCGTEFYYSKLYKPATCNNYNCVVTHLHPELRKSRLSIYKGGE